MFSLFNRNTQCLKYPLPPFFTLKCFPGSVERVAEENGLCNFTPMGKSQDPQRPSLFLQTLTLVVQLEFSAAAVAVINYALTFLGPSTTPDSSALLTQLYLISHRLQRPFWRGLRPTTASLLSHLADEKMEAMCRKLKLQYSDFKTYRLTAQSMLALWQPMTPSTSLGALLGRRPIVEPWFLSPVQ